MKKTTLFVSTLCASMITLAFANTSTDTANAAVVKIEHSYKITKKTTAYKVASSTSKKVFTIPKGKYIVKKGQVKKVKNTSYTKVQYGKKTGYVPTKNIQTLTYTFHSYKKASTTQKAAVYQLMKTQTLRETSGLNHTNKAIKTISKGQFVKLIGTQVVNNVTYARINDNGTIGYVAQKALTVKKASQAAPLLLDLNVVKNIDAPATTITGEVVTPTTEAQRRKIYNIAPDKLYYAYEDPTNPTDETFIRLFEGGLFGYIGNTTINGVEYKQVVSNGIYYYVEKDAIFNELNSSNTFYEDNNNWKENYYYARRNIPVLSSMGYYPKGVKEQLVKNQMFKIVGGMYYEKDKKNDDSKMLLAYKIAYLKNNEIKYGYIHTEGMNLYEQGYEYEEGVETAYNDIIQTKLDNITSSNETKPSTSTKPSTDTATTSIFETKLNDSRLRVINKGSDKVKFYTKAPTSKNKIVGKKLTISSMHFGSVLMIGKSVKTDKGTFVKIAYNNKQTAYIETKYLSNLKGRYVTSSPLDNSFATIAPIKNQTGKYLSTYLHGSKQSYDKYDHSFQIAFNIPVGMTSDGYLVPSTGQGQYSVQYTDGAKIKKDFPFLPYISWEDIKNMKGDPRGKGVYSTPTKIETILKTYGKTKLYDFDLFNTYDDIDIAKTHIALAKLITKYKLENNVYVYSYFNVDNQKDVAKVNAEIKAINPNIKIILTADERKISKTVGKNINKYITDPNIDGFGLSTADMTTTNFRDMKDKNLLVHAISYNSLDALNGFQRQSYESKIDGFKDSSANISAEVILDRFK